jgi:hypothetical protein
MAIDRHLPDDEQYRDERDRAEPDQPLQTPPPISLSCSCEFV